MPAQITGGSLANKMVSQVSCSNSHTCALATDGSVHCWGRNNAGQVGPNGAMTGYNAADVLSPQLVMLSGKALAVGTGGANTNQGATGYSCALLDGGSVQCWGYNAEGELGRSADAGGTAACNGVGGASCSPNPAPVVWQ
jgi:alpha-tubulin suppressor-like RCC1 family protein